MTGQALLVIADIGGYTPFMRLHRTSLAHAQDVVARLLEAIIDAAPNLSLLEVEGDAAFLYTWTPEGQETPIVRMGIDQMVAMHRAFHACQQHIAALNNCSCEGCRETGRLRGGRRINEIRKHVFSNTLKKAEWGNSSIISGDVATGAAKLKQQDGKDLVIYGHGRLGQTLLERNLLDELKLWVHPLFVGRGKILFREAEPMKMKLATTKALRTGVVVLNYQKV